MRTASFLKVLSDPTRLEILDLLKSGSKTSINLQKTVGKSQSTISQQLKILLAEGLIEFDKKGKVKYYKIKNKNIFDVISKVQSFYSSIVKEKMKNHADLDVLDTLG